MLNPTSSPSLKVRVHIDLKKNEIQVFRKWNNFCTLNYNFVCEIFKYYDKSFTFKFNQLLFCDEYYYRDTDHQPQGSLPHTFFEYDTASGYDSKSHIAFKWLKEQINEINLTNYMLCQSKPGNRNFTLNETMYTPDTVIFD